MRLQLVIIIIIIIPRCASGGGIGSSGFYRRRVHVTARQRLVERLRRRRDGNGIAPQYILGRNLAAVKVFIHHVAAANNLAGQTNSSVQALGKAVRVNGCRLGISAAAVAVIVAGCGCHAPIGFSGTTHGSHGHTNIGTQLDAALVAEHEIHGIIRHEQKYVVGKLRTQ